MLRFMLTTVVETVFERQVLQITFPALVTGGAIERMMSQNKFENTLSHLDGLRRVGMHDHALGGNRGAGDL